MRRLEFDGVRTSHHEKLACLNEVYQAEICWACAIRDLQNPTVDFSLECSTAF